MLEERGLFCCSSSFSSSSSGSSSSSMVSFVGFFEFFGLEKDLNSSDDFLLLDFGLDSFFSATIYLFINIIKEFMMSFFLPSVEVESTGKRPSDWIK